MSEDTDERLITALERSFALKDVPRTGWELRDVENPETVASHTWGVGMLVFLFAPDHVDRDRAVRMALVHDVAEAIVGDHPTRADPVDEPIDPEEKTRLERTAFAEELAGLGEETKTLWEAYESHDSPEARFCKDMDLLDLCLQALFYHRRSRYDPDSEDGTLHGSLDEFFVTSKSRLSTERGVELFDLVCDRYEDAKSNRG